jgi:hypothetical protein
MDDTGVAKGTVNTMRKVMRKLDELGHGPEASNISWSKARHLAKGDSEYAEHGDWLEAEADKLVDDIVRFKLGACLTRNPDITALALAKLNPGLPDALVAEWAPEPEFDPHEPGEEDLIF